MIWTALNRPLLLLDNRTRSNTSNLLILIFLGLWSLIFWGVLNYDISVSHAMVQMAKKSISSKSCELIAKRLWNYKCQIGPNVLKRCSFIYAHRNDQWKTLNKQFSRRNMTFVLKSVKILQSNIISLIVWVYQ